MTHVTCRLAAKKNPDQPRNPTLGNRVWAIFTFFTVWGMWKEAPMPKTRSIRPVVSIQHRPVTVGTLDDSACRAGISASRGKSGCRVQICGAFVYGALSFSDKLSSGVAIALIQQFSPRKYVAYPESIASVLSCVSLRTRSIRLYLFFLVN